MPPALSVLGSLELVEQIISYLNFFEYAGPLAASGWTTWHILRVPLLDHAHSLSQFREHMTNIMYWEAQMYLGCRDLDRKFLGNFSDSDDS